MAAFSLSSFSKGSMSNFSKPFSLIPHGFQRGEVSSIKYIFCGRQPAALLRVIVGMTGADGHKLHNTRVSITIDHALRTTIPDQLGGIKVVNIAHGFIPGMASIQIKIPVEIEIFMSTQAAKLFLLLPQMPLHLGKRLRRIDHRKAA